MVFKFFKKSVRAKRSHVFLRERNKSVALAKIETRQMKFNKTKLPVLLA